MSKQVNPARGMRDFLPQDKEKREYAFRVIRENYRQHGFTEIEAPVVEEYSRLHAGLGADNEKLSFNIMRRGLQATDLEQAVAENNPEILADLGLRYDLTVPLARYYASNHAKLPRVFRALQIGPVWRAERPQKGRYRQFIQCDIDIIGEVGILAEVELIIATLSTLEALGVTGCSIKINDRRLLIGMMKLFGFVDAEIERVLVSLDKHDKIGFEGVIAELSEWGATPEAVEQLSEFLKRPLTMEYHPFGEAQIRKLLPQGLDESIIQQLVDTGAAIAAHFEVTDIPLVFDPFLVRGMGYYTGQIFEIVHPDFSYSLGGGGRYDGMIGRFLNAETPAVGFSLGFERLIDQIQLPKEASGENVALVYDKNAQVSSIIHAKHQLMEQGYRVRLVQRPKKLVNTLNELGAEGFVGFTVLDAYRTEVGEIRPIQHS